MKTTNTSLSRQPVLRVLRGGWRCLLVALLTQLRAADIPMVGGLLLRHGDATVPGLGPEAGQQTPTRVVKGRDARSPVTLNALITLEEAKLTAADGAAWDTLGGAVSLSADGNTALVGAATDDTTAGADAGSACVFVRSASGWSQQARLTAADGAASAWFGGAVSLSADGDTALVGAFLDNTTGGVDAGSAYVFVRNGSAWSQQAKLTASDGATYDEFGGRLSLSSDGNTALVGALWANTTRGASAGTAYVFVRSGASWLQAAKLIANDGNASDYFGSSVALSGDGRTALIGAQGGDTTAGVQAGIAYVFQRSGDSWSQQARLTASDGKASDYFGSSVALSGDGHTALVGTINTPTGSHPESAYVYVRDGSNWSQQAKLAAADGQAGDNFGGAVALSSDGRTALVGASTADTAGGTDAGAACVFQRSADHWTQAAKLTAADGAAGDWFGVSVALSADASAVLVGAFSADTSGATNAGSAYVFRLPELASGYNRLAVEDLGGAAVRLTYLGLAGSDYALDRALGLMPPALWEPQATNAAAADGYVVVTNTTDASTKAFWRMRAVP